MSLSSCKNNWWNFEFFIPLEGLVLDEDVDLDEDEEVVLDDVVAIILLV